MPDEELNTGGEPAGELPAGEPAAEVAQETNYEKGSMEETMALKLRELNTDDGADPEVVDEADPAEKPGRARDPAGKFSKAADPAKAAGDPAAVEAPHKTLPTTWKRDLAGEFAKLPESVQQEIHRRESDAFKGIGQYKRDADLGREMAQDFVVPYLDDFKAVNLPAKEALRTVMSTWSQLVRGDEVTRMGIIAQLASDFGISLPAQGDPRNGGANRQVQGDSHEVRALRQELTQLRGHIQGQEQQREQDSLASVRNEFAKFRADPVNEFVDTVAQTMQRLLMAGEAESYKDAYDKACQLNPQVRGQVEARKAQDLQKRLTADAAAARKAAGSNVVRRGTPTPAAKTGSMDDTIRSTLRAITARNG